MPSSHPHSLADLAFLGSILSKDPRPPAALLVSGPLTNAFQNFPVPGLGLAPVATIFLVFSKAAAVDSFKMMCAIQTGTRQANGTYVLDGTRTDLCYTGTEVTPNRAIGLNSYGSGFWTFNANLANSRVVLLTAKLYNNTINNNLQLWLNGQLQNLSLYPGGLPPRTWSDTFTLGGDTNSSYTWQGTIYHARVYLDDLTDPYRAEIEQVLLASYPIS
ncbi:hypothetical protein [uncultured Hymenobacter sp.]|uniref:hypothetical protein n=1 Tax=uncultured Hymenobacter sp. TaxID=170016 RepID=UPI0035CA2D11